MPNTTYLVDSSIYVFRAWFTLPASITDAAGNPANAVFGFSDVVYKLLKQERPARIGFGFDESLTTSHRNAIYPAYKANRESAPAELKHQFQLARRFLRGIGISEFGSDRYEADDLIGTLARIEREQGQRLVIVTGDKDLAQLIHEQDLWWEFGKDQRMDAKGIQKRFGVRPDQIADQLAIAGDKVDNIPGVPGVGMATAACLLRKFDNVEILLSRIPEIAQMKVRGAKRLMGLIDEHQDTIRLARQLTGIHLEADLPADLQLAPRPPEQDAFDATCDELDMSPERRARWERLLDELHGG